MNTRIVGNNKNIYISSFVTDGEILSANTWNTYVSDNFNTMIDVVNRIPAQSIGTITQAIPASVSSWNTTSFINSRHLSLFTSWNTLSNYIDNNGNTIFDIVPKSVLTGSTIFNRQGNYWVFQTPGIYHISVSINVTPLVIPSSIRIAIVPYVNDGILYYENAPFDGANYNRINDFSTIIIADTKKIDNNTTTSFTHSVSGYFVVSNAKRINSSSSWESPIKNSINPLISGNGYHIEIEGHYTSSQTNRFSITEGEVVITLLEEWWT